MRNARSSQLAPRDAWFLFSDEAIQGDDQSIITNFYVFDTVDDPDPITTYGQALGWLTARVREIPSLRRRIRRVPADLDYPSWVPADTIDPADHLTVHHVGATNRNALHDLFANSARRHMDLSRPPWDVEIFTGVQGIEDIPEGATVVTLRVHHSFTDGLGAVAVARALFDAPDARPAAVATVNASQSLLKSAFSLPAQFWTLGRSLFASMSAQRRLSALAESNEIRMPIPHRPRTRLNDSQNNQRQFGRVRLSLDDVREIAKSTGTTVNDVVLATVAGGLQAYLTKHGEAPNSALAAQVPRSTRNNSRSNAENQVTTMYVDLHTTVPEPLARLRLINESARYEKERVERPEAVAIEATLDHAPAFYLKAALRRPRAVKGNGHVDQGLVPLANTAVSNVPRGAADLVFGSAPVVDGFSAPAIHPGAGLGHVATSIGSVLTLTFTADSAVMPDTVLYTALLSTAFSNLRVAAGTATP
ncbi:wax ester/triacylglycerol synthase domain-containing protein [Rhodococcus sp. NPDC054953]